MKALKISLLALAISTALTGCELDGDQGLQGEQGIQGEQGPTGSQGTEGVQGEQGKQGLANAGKLTRLATVPLGAEVTGAFVSDDGHFFFNAQHPADTNTTLNADNVAINKGTVGAVIGLNMKKLPKNIPELPVAQTDAERESVRVAIGTYQVIGQNGDTYNNTITGASALGHIMDSTGAQLIVDSNAPDFNGYIPTSSTEGYLFTNWESIPGGMSRLKLTQQADLTWAVSEPEMLDFSAIKGTAANCFGSVTPWQTPLTSEEWIIDDNVNSTSAGWNKRASSGRQAALTNYVDIDADGSDFPNPYRYGYIVEVKDAVGSTPTPVKHFTLGRVEHENSVVMPDRKTVYTTQDDTGGVLLKFVADQAEDLSSGTLYAAKLTQDNTNEPLVTGFDVSWIELASGNNAEIEAWIAEFDSIKAADDPATETEKYLTLADVTAWSTGAATYPTLENGGNETTAGKAMDNRIAFIETRQAAKAKGATVEFRKLEGINVNINRAIEAVEGTDLIANEDVDKAYVYFAISDLDNTMTDGEGDIALNTRVKDCGGVYRMPLEANYNISRIEPVLMGATMTSGVSNSEKCNVNEVAQPDNVIVLDDGRILIGEDGSQTNNTLWLYNPVAE